MADHDFPNPLHGPDDDVPRGGSWVRWTAISLALVLAVAFAPQSWKLPLGILSVLTLLVGLGKLVLTKSGERDG
jgi:hypothetical protein